MDRNYMINGYINDDVNNLKEKNQSLEYLDELKFRINDTKTIAELMIEVSTFLSKNNVTDEIKNGITKICDEFDENIDILTARKRLEDYLSSILIENGYQKSNELVNDIKNDVVKDADKLESAGVNLNSDTEDAINSINGDVTNLYDYFYEKNKVLNTDTKNIDMNMSNVDEIVESPKDDILLSETIEDEKRTYDTENFSLFQTNDNGTVQVNGDYTNKNSLNFAVMMTMALLVHNDGKVESNLDMKFIKNKNEKNKFRIIYGNFPLINHPENKLDSTSMSKISVLSKTYRPDINYMEILGRTSPIMKEAMSIIYTHVLNRDGAFQMAIRNNDGNHDMAFGMDENYNDILDAFNTNGAYVSYDENEHGIVTVNETIPGNQLFILNTTNEALGANFINNDNNGLNNNYQRVKKIEINDVAKANYVLLAIMCVTEVLLLSIYFIFLFNK